MKDLHEEYAAAMRGAMKEFGERTQRAIDELVMRCMEADTQFMAASEGRLRQMHANTSANVRAFVGAPAPEMPDVADAPSLPTDMGADEDVETMIQAELLEE